MGLIRRIYHAAPGAIRHGEGEIKISASRAISQCLTCNNTLSMKQGWIDANGRLSVCERSHTTRAQQSRCINGQLAKMRESRHPSGEICQACPQNVS